MKIRQLMIPDPVTVTEAASVEDALDLMKTHRIRHLPVVDRARRLKGFLTLADLKRGLLPYMLGELTLKDLMIRNPLTVKPEDDIETAAQIIYRRKIGGLPVVDAGGTLVGIITETDLLRTFIDMMGILAESVRIDVRLPDTTEALARAMATIAANGGTIITVSMAVGGDDRHTYTFRLRPCPLEPIHRALEADGCQVLSVLR